MSIKAVIIDDEELAIYALMHELKLHFNQIEVAGSAQSVEDGIALLNRENIDLVFLDIQIEDKLGFEILEALPNLKAKIVFTTAYSHYAIKAIKYAAFDYLLKPIDVNELKETIEKIENEKINKEILEFQIRELQAKLIDEENEKDVLIKNGSTIEKIKIENIEFIEAYGNYSKIWLKEKWLISDNNLKQNERLFEEYGFIRISRFSLVNKEAVLKCDFFEKSITLLSGKTLDISVRKLPYVRKTFTEKLP